MKGQKMNIMFDGAITKENADLQKKRAKVMMYGSWKVGKTSAMSQLPKAYFIDTEDATDWCQNEILSRGGIIKKTSSFDEVSQIIEYVGNHNPGVMDNGEPYEYWSLVIDSLTPLYLNLQETLSKDGGGLTIQQWGKLKTKWKNFMLRLLDLDMNVFATSHETVEYDAEMVRIRTKPDSEKRDPHWFDFIFVLELADKNNKSSDRYAITKGERSPIGKPIFPDRFRWSYNAFSEYLFNFFGVDILERTPKTVMLATQEQIDTLRNLINLLNYPEEDVAKWLEKARVDNLDKLSGEQSQACIDKLEKLRKQRAKELSDPQFKASSEKPKPKTKKESDAGVPETTSDMPSETDRVQRAIGTMELLTTIDEILDYGKDHADFYKLLTDKEKVAYSEAYEGFKDKLKKPKDSLL